MGRKRKVVTVEELPEDEPVVAVEDDLVDDPLETALIELAGSASSFTIFRLPLIGQSGKRKFCCSYPSEELGEQGIEAFVAERWGGGRYMVTARGRDGSILKNQSFEIDASVKPKVELTEPPRDTTKNELVELVREVLRERGNGGNGQSSDVTAAMVQSAGQTAAAMMTMMQPLIAQLAANAKPEPTPWETLTPMLTAALELGAETRGGGGDGPASYLPLIEKFATILDKAQSRGHVPGEPPAQIPKKVEAMPSVVLNPNEPGWVKGLRPYLPFVLEKARADVPPEFFVGELEQSAPRIVDWLAERDPETWPGELAAFVPELQPYTGWIKRLLEAISEADEEQAEEPAGLEGEAN